MEFTVETEIQQVTPDRVRIQSEPVPNTPVPDSAHNTHSAPNLIPDPISDQDSDTLSPTSEQDGPGEQNQQQQVIGSRTPEEN